MSHFLAIPVVFALLLAITPVAATPLTKLCSGQPQRLAAYSGVYVNSGILTALARTHSWTESVIDSGGISELSIDPTGQISVSWSWHEAAAWGLDVPPGCVTARGHTIFLEDSEKVGLIAFTRIGDFVPSSTTYYFDKLFHGCFSEQSGQRWCFGAGQLTIDGRRMQTNLVLDPSELPILGTALKVNGDEQLWLFVPVQNGWDVFRSKYASDERYVAPDRRKPWRQLRLSP